MAAGTWVRVGRLGERLINFNVILGAAYGFIDRFGAEQSQSFSVFLKLSEDELRRTHRRHRGGDIARVDERQRAALPNAYEGCTVRCGL
jgi:hypothetical protein